MPAKKHHVKREEEGQSLLSFSLFDNRRAGERRNEEKDFLPEPGLCALITRSGKRLHIVGGARQRG